ncbi:hypothetical protein TRVL_08567 [Trypanosoma vivax]|nr:hypothetical protein TRVL_08567 [Trypanosoma vivax]
MLFGHTQVRGMRVKREAWHMFRCVLAFTLNYITFCAASTSCCLSATKHRSAKAFERPTIKANTKQQHKSVKIGLPVTMAPVLFYIISRCAQRIAAPTTGSAAKRNVCRVMEN